MMLRALDGMPVNVLLLGKGNTVSRRGARRASARPARAASSSMRTGARPRRRSTRACAPRSEVVFRSRIHTDTLNEAGYLEITARGDRRALDPRLPHRGRRGRARAGHHRDRRRIPTCCPSSTNPTRPHTVNTVAEHLDMLMVCHHLNPRLPEDLAFAETRIRAGHDRRRGRAPRSRRDLDDRLRLAGDGARRRDDRPHLADGTRDEAPARARSRRRRPADNAARPALRRQVHDLPGDRPRPGRRVGSVEVGKLADLVLWDPLLRRSGPTSCSRAARSPGRRSATPTPRSRPPSRCFGRPMFAAAASCGRSSLGRVRRAGGARGRARGARSVCARSCVPVADTRGDRQGRHAAQRRPAGDPRRCFDTFTVTRRRRADRAATLRPSCRWRSATSCFDRRGRAPPARRQPRPRQAPTRTPAGSRRAVARRAARRSACRRSCDGRLHTVAFTEAASPPRGARRRRSDALGALDAEARRAHAEPAAARRRERRLGRAILRTGGSAVPRGARRSRDYRERSDATPAAGRARRRLPRPRASTRRGRRAARALHEDAATVAGRRGQAARRSTPAPPPAGSPTLGAETRPTRPRCRRTRRQLPSVCGAAHRAALARPRADQGGSLPAERNARARMRVGIGGPVGTGKSSLIADALPATSSAEFAARRRHQRHLHHRGRRIPALDRRAAGRSGSRAVQTGCCPHTAIRDDITANLEAVEELERREGPLDIVLRRVRRRQPHRRVRPGARRRADLRARLRRRRRRAAQGRPRDQLAPTCS